MRLKRGDVLVKKRGGATKRLRVIRVASGQVALEALAPCVKRKPRARVRTLVLPVGEGGLPEGYVRAPTHWATGRVDTTACGRPVNAENTTVRPGDVTCPACAAALTDFIDRVRAELQNGRPT